MKIKKIAISLVAVTTLAVANASSLNSGILFVVSGKFSQCYLGGFTHYNYIDEDSSSPPHILEAFNASKVLFVESLSNKQEYKKDLAIPVHTQKRYLLSDIVDDSIKSLDRKFHVDLKAKNLDPFWLELNSFNVAQFGHVVLMTGRALRLAQRQPVEDIVANYSMNLNVLALKKGIPVGALEQPDYHYTLWDGLADSDMHGQFIKDSYLTALDDDFISTESKINNAVLVGNLTELDKVFKKTFSQYPSKKFEFEKIIATRNQSWANKLDFFLNQRKDSPCFVSVGALHFLGENSLTSLLEKKGYKIERIKNSNDLNRSPQKN
jgi:uncharacterized protein YbaP (TraB family)